MTTTTMTTTTLRSRKRKHIYSFEKDKPIGHNFDPHQPAQKRVKYTPEQLQILEKAFEADPRPSLEKRQQLSLLMNRNPRSIQIWFQNKRAKTRKREDPSSSHITIDNKHRRPRPLAFSECVGKLELRKKSNRGKSKQYETESSLEPKQKENFVSKNDIPMAVSSLTDTISAAPSVPAVGSVREIPQAKYGVFMCQAFGIGTWYAETNKEQTCFLVVDESQEELQEIIVTQRGHQYMICFHFHYISATKLSSPDDSEFVCLNIYLKEAPLQKYRIAEGTLWKTVGDFTTGQQASWVRKHEMMIANAELNNLFRTCPFLESRLC